MLKKVLIILVVTLLFTSCEETAKILIEGDNPPTFKLSGSGTPYFFVFGEEGEKKDKVKYENIPDNFSNVIWFIEPEKDSNPKALWRTPFLKYGEVPEGFIQIFPKTGKPAPLEEGKKYYFAVPTYNAQGTVRFFVVKDNKTIAVAP